MLGPKAERASNSLPAQHYQQGHASHDQLFRKRNILCLQVHTLRHLDACLQSQGTKNAKAVEIPTEEQQLRRELAALWKIKTRSTRRNGRRVGFEQTS